MHNNHFAIANRRNSILRERMNVTPASQRARQVNLAGRTTAKNSRLHKRLKFFAVHTPSQLTRMLFEKKQWLERVPLTGDPELNHAIHTIALDCGELILGGKQGELKQYAPYVLLAAEQFLAQAEEILPKKPKVLKKFPS